MTGLSTDRGSDNIFRRSVTQAFWMMRDPWKSLQEVSSSSTRRSIGFMLTLGAVTAFLTPLQVLLGYEDINGLHAGGQAEYLARDLSSMLGLGILWRPVLVESLYVLVLLITTTYLHVILRALGGKAHVRETMAMIAYGDTPGLLFGWIPYVATVSAVWAAVIQILIGPVVVHKLPWAKTILVFSILLGMGLLEIALS